MKKSKGGERGEKTSQPFEEGPESKGFKKPMDPFLQNPEDYG